jgi:hypothetical protein
LNERIVTDLFQPEKYPIEFEFANDPKPRLTLEDKIYKSDYNSLNYYYYVDFKAQFEKLKRNLKIVFQNQSHCISLLVPNIFKIHLICFYIKLRIPFMLWRKLINISGRSQWTLELQKMFSRL